MMANVPEERSPKPKPAVKLRQTCDACQVMKSRCSRDQPTCARCQAQGLTCHYSASRRLGRPRRLAPPPPSPTTAAHRVRPEEPTPVDQISIEQPQPPGAANIIGGSQMIPSSSQIPNQIFATDWSDIDVDIDNDRILTNDSEAPSDDLADSMNGNQQFKSMAMTSQGKNAMGNVSTSSLSSAHGSVRGHELDQEHFNSFSSTDVSQLPTPFRYQSLSSEFESFTNQITPQESLEAVEGQSSAIPDIDNHFELNHLASPIKENELVATRQFSWDLSAEGFFSTWGGTCKCFELALSITISIERSQAVSRLPELDRVLDLESQLREAVPRAVVCEQCKARQEETLSLLCRAMSHVVDLFQQHCDAEFADDINAPVSKRQRTSSVSEGFDWLQIKAYTSQLSVAPGSRLPKHSASNSGQSSSAQRTSAGVSYAHEMPTPPRTANSNFYPFQTQPQLGTQPEGMGNTCIKIGQHSIVDNDRKCVLLHLLRRRLTILANILESLIRALQDLRIASRRPDATSMSYENGRPTETETRRATRTASKVYDIIDQLEGLQI